MNLKALKDPFPESDIEWRIGQSGKKKDGTVWAKCLAYVSARAVQDRLDEVAGPGGWKSRYRTDAGSEKMTSGVIAEIAIKIGEEWVTKEDGAEQTDFEAFKGGISSAFKRAGAAWGIGRYLYDLEADFAEVSMTKRDGFQYAKHKDPRSKEETEFYWRAPKLPSWALPVSSVAQKSAQKPVETSEDKKPETRSECIAAIMKAAETLRCSQKELADWVAEVFKKPTKELSIEELGQFLEILQGEIGRKGDVA